MPFKVHTKHFTKHTTKRHEFIKITDEVKKVIKDSGILNGLLAVQTHHTTCGVWVNEDEENLIGHDNERYGHDLKKVLDRFASPDDEYCHDDICDVNNPNGKRHTHLCEADPDGVIRECRNGHAHAQSLIVPHCIHMVIENGKLVKGRWQEIMLVELDHDRERKFTVHIQGTTD